MAETCDTSVLVPALLAWHGSHEPCRRALTEISAVPAHVLLETYSVLTRLPPPHRLSAADASAAVAGLSLPAVALPAEEAGALIPALGTLGISGGAAYDAVVGVTARHHGLRLVSRDVRARRTYDLLDVAHRMIVG